MASFPVFRTLAVIFKGNGTTSFNIVGSQDIIILGWKNFFLYGIPQIEGVAL